MYRWWTILSGGCKIALERDARRVGSPGTGDLHMYTWPGQHGSLRLITTRLGHPVRVFQENRHKNTYD